MKVENTSPVIKRVRQIADEIDAGYIDEYKEMPVEVLAFRLKLLASEHNCYIKSWVYQDKELPGIAECYCAADYEEEDEDTWELFTQETEAEAIIASFKWLADRGYFIKEEI